MRQYSRDPAPRATPHRRRWRAVVLRVAWLLFCGYMLSATSCPVFVAERNEAIRDAVPPLANRIYQLSSSIPDIPEGGSCTPEQARTAAAAMRQLLEVCVQVQDLQRRLGQLRDAISDPALVEKLNSTGVQIILVLAGCAAALDRYRRCNPSDHAFLNAWYQSGDPTVPPLPGYEQEPRGQQPTPPSPPAYTPPGPD